jgi:hypothetical protein
MLSMPSHTAKHAGSTEIAINSCCGQPSAITSGATSRETVAIKKADWLQNAIHAINNKKSHWSGQDNNKLRTDCTDPRLDRQEKGPGEEAAGPSRTE